MPKSSPSIQNKTLSKMPPSRVAAPSTLAITTKQMGDAAEARALAHLQAAGLTLVARNVKSPGRGGGEIDLIMKESDGTLVFVEVRHRQHHSHGGAAASVNTMKQRRIVYAARHYLAHLPEYPPCRFDVVAFQDHAQPPLVWLRGAFDADA
jgi:putative endonuclease